MSDHKTVTLVLLRHFQRWNPGERAGFEAQLAEELVKRGVAQYAKPASSEDVNRAIPKAPITKA